MTVVYISPEFDVQVLGMQGIHTAEGERATCFDSSALKFVYQVFVGISVHGHQNFPEYLCFWCLKSIQTNFARFSYPSLCL